MNNIKRKNNATKKSALRKDKIVKFMWIAFGSIVGFVFLFMILIYNGIIGYMPSIETSQIPMTNMRHLSTRPMAKKWVDTIPVRAIVYIRAWKRFLNT